MANISLPVFLVLVIGTYILMGLYLKWRRDRMK